MFFSGRQEKQTKLTLFRLGRGDLLSSAFFSGNRPLLFFVVAFHSHDDVVNPKGDMYSVGGSVDGRSSCKPPSVSPLVIPISVGVAGSPLVGNLSNELKQRKDLGDAFGRPSSPGPSKPGHSDGWGWPEASIYAVGRSRG